MRHRHETGGDEFFENLYWCAFLLHLIGDPADVPMMWQAKHSDFDTAAGFDVQFLLGAGAETTLTYLTGHARADIARGTVCLPRTPRGSTDLDRRPPKLLLRTWVSHDTLASQPTLRCVEPGELTPAGDKDVRDGFPIPMAHLPTRRRMPVTTSWSGPVTGES